jgi:TolB-like protein
MKPLLKRILTLVTLGVLFQTAMAAGAATSVAPVAVFPLQDMSQGRNGLNIPFTKYLIKRLEEGGTETCRFETVISFMSHNRIRYAGQLETYHITRVREELGAAFVLLGSIIQKKEIPSPSFGVSLNLVQTSDGHTIWSFVGAVSGAEDRKLLGIGEATSVKDLEPVLGDEIMTLWPGEALNQQQQRSASVDSIVLQPKRVIPGAEVHCSVRLRNLWLESRTPRVFMKADDQIYAASFSPGSNTYATSWIAGQEDGRFPVTLILEWPLYGRTETVQLGYYLVDGVSPLIALDLKGEAMEGEIPVFRDKVIVIPHRLIRKPIARWHIYFRNKDDVVVADQESKGELPEMIVWRGRNNMLGGIETGGLYRVFLDVWDEAGNKASASSQLELNSRAPKVAVTAEKEGSEVMVDLKHESKVPLAFWRLEMWSKEGKLLKTAEGQDLPVQIGVELPSTEENQDIEGTLVVQDVLGNKAKSKFDNLLRPPEPEKVKAEIIEEKTATKAWVEEF